MVGVSVDGEVVLAAGGEGGDGRALGSAEEGVVALAGVVGARGGERGGHVVVDVVGRLGEGVELRLQRGRIGHVHVGCGEGGAQEGEEGGGHEERHLVRQGVSCGLCCGEDVGIKSSVEDEDGSVIWLEN